MNSFVEVRNPWDLRWQKFLSYRWPTMKAALNLFHQAHGETMLETGCVRQMDDAGAGYSTYVFGDYLKERGHGKLITVDIDSHHLDICKEITAPFAAHIQYELSDSVCYLTNYTGPKIDLLYLDSYDYPIVEIARLYEGKYEDVVKMMLEGGKETALKVHPEFIPPQQHCLVELRTALPHLSDKAVVLLDDRYFPGGGKPERANEHLSSLGWTCILDDGQSLWIRR